MGTMSSTESSKDWSIVKWLARNRVSAFFFVLLLVAISETAATESDMFLHAVDDYADLTIAVVAILLLAMWWKKQTPAQLKRTANVMAVLAALVIVATLFAISQEIGDPEDFGNEIPTLFFGIFLLINRFV